MRLHVFDLDGTLLPGTSACKELAKQTGTVREVAALESKLRNDNSTVEFARGIHSLWRGLTDEVVATAFADAPKLNHIAEVVSDIIRRGEHGVVITMSPNFFARYFIAIGLEVLASTFPPLPLTTELDETAILVPEDKPRLVAELCRKYALGFNDVLAYGDSWSDIPLFQQAARSVAINAEDAVRELATVEYQGYDLLSAYDMIRRHLGTEGQLLINYPREDIR